MIYQLLANRLVFLEQGVHDGFPGHDPDEDAFIVGYGNIVLADDEGLKVP